MHIRTQFSTITIEPAPDKDGNPGRWTGVMLTQGKQRIFINSFAEAQEAEDAAIKLAEIMGVPDAKPRLSPFQEALVNTTPQLAAAE